MSQPPKKKQDTPTVQPVEQKDPNEKYYVKNRYDPYSLKFSLDEYITDALQKNYKIKQIHNYENIKILLGILTTGVMLLSQFYPLPFPKNFYILLGCCVAYYILSGIYTYFEERIVKNTFVQFLYPFDKVASAKTKEIKFASKIDLFSDVYNLDIFYRPADQKQFPYEEIKNVLKVGDYFYEDGKPHFEAIDKFLAEALSQMKGR